MKPYFHIITGKEIAEVIVHNAHQIQDIIKSTYLLHYQDQTINPNSYFLRYPDKPQARIIALPAHIGGEVNVSGIKWIASNPDNIKIGLPRASAILILNDAETGFPFACMESSIISATRTAASAVLAADCLRKGDKKKVKLGIVGAGVISRYFYHTLVRNGWEIERVAIHDVNTSYANQFLEKVCQEEHQAHVVDSARTLIQTSDVIFFATSSTTPTISDASWFAHNPLVLHISLRDLSPEILIQSNNIVDDVDHVLSANTSPHLTEQQVGHRKFINGTLAGYIQNTYPLDSSKPSIFSPMGMGILDLALGKFIYDTLRERNNLTEVEDFFCDLERHTNIKSVCENE